MVFLESRLENTEAGLTDYKKFFAQYGFVLGGNWDYDSGCFDRALDDSNQVWLRVPFTSVQGEIDGNAEDDKTKVRIGTPFVLNHVYHEGNDDTAHFMTVRAFVDQFQTPLDKDGKVESAWVEAGQKVLREVESAYLESH